MKQTLTVHTLYVVVRRALFMHIDAETPILQARYQEHSLHLEWRMVEACDSLPLLWGIPALVPRKASSQTEIPSVSLGQRLRKGRGLFGVVANSQILCKHQDPMS